MHATELLRELEPDAARLLDRHLDASKEWFPHEYVPYERAAALRGTLAEREPVELVEVPDGVRSALFINLLTEDNLPYYFRKAGELLGEEAAYPTWVRRWTAEEGRHSMVIYGYLMVGRLVDPVWLERARMVQVSTGKLPDIHGPHQGLAYLTLQELATRISHRNTGKLLDDPEGFALMSRVAQDENLHHLFYRDLATRAFEVDPSSMVIAAEQVVTGFEMPGTGIPDFDRHAKAIAKAGIYDLAIHHDQVVAPMVDRVWKIAGLTGLSPEADAARERLLAFTARLGKVAKRLGARRPADDDGPADT
jgi:acyl-[acyl-carrier-protein] desaturase